MTKKIVIALGGNAINKPKQRGTAEEQLANVEETCRHIAEIIRRGNSVIVTHGNGPQVGNILIQNEEARVVVPPMPLDICGAQTQGLIGYMIQRSLGNELQRLDINRPVVTVVTQVVVDENDPGFQNPTKPIGPFYTAGKAQELMEKAGYKMKEDAGRGWRRVVPSPDPKRIYERETIKALVDTGAIVVASGGGGIPVAETPAGLKGIEAVIDKDLAGQKLAADVGADIFVILTDVPKVAINYGTPEQQNLDRLTVAEARKYMQEGHFKAGSMGPKVLAAVRFVEAGGEKAIITSLDTAVDALYGDAGTQVTA